MLTPNMGFVENPAGLDYPTTNAAHKTFGPCEFGQHHTVVAKGAKSMLTLGAGINEHSKGNGQQT
jgi:hypothetical protein